MRTLVVILLLSLNGPLLGVAAAQPASDVTLPPIEVSTSLSFDLHRSDAPPTGVVPGAVLAVTGNFGDHLAVTTEVARTSHHATLMAGPRVSTGFYRDGGGMIPGRFFAEALAGVEHRPDAHGAALLVGAGADVLLGPRGVSLHWALDYLFRPGGAPQYSGGRFLVGLVFGPHVAKHRQLSKSLTGDQEFRS